MSNHIVVVGSANMDLVFGADRIPKQGETVIGSSFAEIPGGKGANQAAAIAKLGGEVSLLGCVGDDPYGNTLRDGLSAMGVDVSLLKVASGFDTGLASISVAKGGENTIIVIPGANETIDTNYVRACVDLHTGAVLTQLEIPLSASVAAMTGKGLRVLNPAPVKLLPPEVLSLIDYLTPNEAETETLTGIRPVDDSSCRQAAKKLFDLGSKCVVMTLGARGSFLAAQAAQIHIESILVRPIDTTAAGDAFNGALTLFLSHGRDPANAVALANRVGALSTTKHGAQPSMPTLEELREVARDLL